MHRISSFPQQLPRLFTIVVTCLLLTACASGTDWGRVGTELLAANSSRNDTSLIGAGLKEALRVGSDTVVGQLGQTDGFNTDKLIHIPLPKNFQKVQSTLKSIGMSSLLDDLELRLNRAAEQATPKAKELFWSAIEEMTLDDVMGIFNGPQDAATRYFEKKMSPPLGQAMRPIVDEALQQAGAVRAYDKVMGQYRSVPFVPDIKADLTAHVVDLGMKGIFHYLAKEEAAIRQNPIKRTTELLRKVFGSR